VVSALKVDRLESSGALQYGLDLGTLERQFKKKRGLRVVDAIDTRSGSDLVSAGALGEVYRLGRPRGTSFSMTTDIKEVAP